MGREIGRKHDSLINFARGITKEPNPTTRKRLEALYRVWAPVLENKEEIPVLHFKGLLLEMMELLPEDLGDADAVLKQLLDPPDEGVEEDSKIAALRPHMLRLLLRMVDTGYAILHRYDKQAYKPKKRKPKKPKDPADVDYLAGIPPAEGVEEPKKKPKPKKRRPPEDE